MIAAIERIFLSPEPHDTLTPPRRTRYFHVLHVCQLFPASWRVAPHARARALGAIQARARARTPRP